MWLTDVSQDTQTQLLSLQSVLLRNTSSSVIVMWGNSADVFTNALNECYMIKRTLIIQYFYILNNATALPTGERTEALLMDLAQAINI